MYVLYDIGGTKTRIATTTDLETFTEPKIIPTPESFEEGVAAVTDAVRDVCGDAPVAAMAGGIAASPDRERTRIVGGGPNIADWIEQPIKQRFEEELDTTMYMENDTAMGGLAQVARGPARGAEIAVYVTVSTGVGGCRFVDGRIDKSAFGFEPGWQIIGTPLLCGDAPDADRWHNGYCSYGYLMSHIGGACTEKKEGQKPYEITDKAFWDEKARLLAHGLHNITTMWSPDVIVVGGSMMNEIGITLGTTEQYLKETISDVFTECPRLAKAEFGDEMGLYGAMEYVKQVHEKRAPSAFSHS